MADRDLTIVLTLRGRHLHTLRWLWYANLSKLPYHIIIADGEVVPAIDRLLSDPHTFPNLSFEYHRHSDLTFSDFYEKLVDTIGRVKTKYVMLADNDDFLITPGIQKSISFMNAEPEYVCAGGRVPDFTIAPSKNLRGNVIGELVGARFGYKYECRDISFPSRADRVMEEITKYQTIHYHVYRTQALQMIFAELKAHDFSDLTVAEYYIALRAVTLGKVRTDPSVVCYFRQTGTSMLSSYYKDWVHHLLHSRLPQDYRAMAAAIANEVGQDDGNGSADFEEKILEAYGEQIRFMLAHTMLRYRFPRLFRVKRKLLWLGKLRVSPQRYRQRLQMRKFWAELTRHCPDPALLAQYRQELRDIAVSLQGNAFLSFVKTQAPELQ